MRARAKHRSRFVAAAALVIGAVGLVAALAGAGEPGESSGQVALGALAEEGSGALPRPPEPGATATAPPAEVPVEPALPPPVRLRMRAVRDGGRLAIAPVNPLPADLVGPPAPWELDGDTEAMASVFFRSARGGFVPADLELLELLGRIYEA